MTRHRGACPARAQGGLVRGLLLAGVLLAAGAATAILVALEHVGVTPRALAPYVEKRSSGHNPVIVGTGLAASRVLLALDRGEVGPLAADELQRLNLGAQSEAAHSAAAAAGTPVAVQDLAGLRAALAGAQPGSVITLAPGSYRIEGRSLEANRPGRAQAPIVVRAARPGSVELLSPGVVGIKVSAPYWRFENLTLRGVCRDDSACEHAFHVVGGASHFEAVNNTIGGFNAHFKINGHDGRFPDHGLIEGNTLFNPAARATRNPVTLIDLVAASGWTVRGNVIRDFVKLQGNQVSYGAFFKGGGSGNVFERNLVWCERELTGLPGQRIGLSLGGGATGAMFCRDGRCITEQDGGVLRANLIVGCSDVGIYLNSAANSRIEDNTLVDTAGIDVRYASSSARIDGNLIDGAIRSRDGGLVHLGDNRSGAVWQAFVGYHPVRRLFTAPERGDFLWRDGALLRDTVASGERSDLCGATRAATGAYGAFEDFGACLRR